jgi:hypothetical protein
MNAHPEEDTFAKVCKGMRVVDSSGDELGTVESVKMGDPGVVTEEGQDVDNENNRGLLGAVVEVFQGDRLPPQVTAQLLRTGFVKVDGKGLLASDFYVGVDGIDEVSGDVVRLSPSAAQYEPDRLG